MLPDSRSMLTAVFTSVGSEKEAFVAEFDFGRFFDAIVIGSGAAGYSAACRIAKFGRKTCALVTEGVNIGTSRNTGSDKQTYYKLGLGGDSTDSVVGMARDLFSGGAVDGDNALCEAALSAQSFLNLAELGVPFPVNRYGEYVGYKTDHDKYARATSAGPLTSKLMTEALQSDAEKRGVNILSDLLAIEILKHGGRVCGLLCLRKADGRLISFRCDSVIMATGGPAGIYFDSVYPACHTGSSSLALLAGASFQNLTEWQYGLASTAPRWNVSGTYMQVLPRMYSVGSDGTEHEFTLDFFGDCGTALSALFLKGYQWPFDCAKIENGSSVIDLLVYRESILYGRRVFLDYRTNPFGAREIDYSLLSEEARTYLEKAGACFGTPFDRLMKMNPPAIELYRSKGVDLETEPLEIALCAQHNNGGASVDLWWQTSVPGLFVIGEAAGTHGIKRPGGSALNAGQVGALRAAEYISFGPKTKTMFHDYKMSALSAVERQTLFCNAVLANKDNADGMIAYSAKRMSGAGGAIREIRSMLSALSETESELENFTSVVGVKSKEELYKAYKLFDILNMERVVLYAMLDYMKTVGFSRGSSLYTDKNGILRDGLEELFRFCPEKQEYTDMIQEIMLVDGKPCVHWRARRPIPDDDRFFENVWAGYRKNRNIY